MARVRTWRSSLWARWLGWTAVFTGGLVLCGASLVWENSPLWVLGDGSGFLAIVLVPAALALAIGVRFAHWSWVIGVLVAIVLLAAILVREWTGLPYERGTAQGMIGIMLWVVIHLLVMPPAAAA